MTTANNKQARNASLPRRRLSREEAQAQTRARLIAVGREHFIRYGLSGAVAEKIAETAGYSRGALYSNFTGKEELFLAVMEKDHQEHCAAYEAIFAAGLTPKELLHQLRTAYINLLMNSDWVMLWADFQSEAARSADLQARFKQFYSDLATNVIKTLREHIRSGKLVSRLEPDGFLLAMDSFAHGLAMRQRLLGAEFEEKKVRKLVGAIFDMLLTTPSD